MNILPIVGRELRVAARRPATYRVRFCTALTVAAIGAYLLWIFAAIRGGGGAIFTTVTVCIAVFAAFSASASYDSISREKREGTIGFLFLTDLKGRDIVLGKLAASALPSIYAAMGVLPVLAIAMLMGGVNARQFWETSFAVLNLFFLSHAVAMFGSALFQNRRNSAGFPALVAVGYAVELALSAIAGDYRKETASLVLQALNPAHALIVALESVAHRGTASFGISLAAVHLTGWAFVALASWVLPHRWQEKPRRPNPLREWKDQLRFGTVARRAVLRRRLIGINPFFWLVSRRQLGPASIWIAFGAFGTCLGSLAVLAVVKEKEPWNNIYPAMFIFATVVFHFALKFQVAGFASGCLQTQRNDGGLETVLCCTPLPASDIIAGQWLALRRWLLGPALAVLALGLVMIAAAWISQGRDQDNLQLIGYLLAATFILLPDMIALGWAGMLTAMSQPRTRSNGNAIGAVLCVCVVPWVIIGATLATLGAFGKLKEPVSPWAPWVILATIQDVTLCAILSRQLRRNFRKWAVPSYDPPLTLWGRLGRFLGKIVRNLRSNKLVN